MKNTLLKFYLIWLFASILLILSWFFESTGITSDSVKRFINPLSLNVQQLKRFLQMRGISYLGFVEKTEYVEKIEESGHVSEGEVKNILSVSEVDDTYQEISNEVTEFTSTSHFYELVEDNKDSIWFIQVVAESSMPLINQNKFGNLRENLHYFGIKAGILWCHLIPEYCALRGWKKSLIIVALPKTQSHKSSVGLNIYTKKSLTSDSVLTWINSLIFKRIKQNFQDSQHPKTTASVSLLTSAPSPPLFFSALSVKFTGRAHFSFFSVPFRFNRDHINVIGNYKFCQSLHNQHFPFKTNSPLPSNISLFNPFSCYFVTLNNKTLTYGYNFWEEFNFRQFMIFLHYINPDLNDLLIWSLLLTNSISLCQFLITKYNNFIFRLLDTFWVLFKWNLFVICLWMPLLALIQTNVGKKLASFIQSLYFHLVMSSIGNIPLYLFSYYRLHPFIFFSILITCIFLFEFARKTLLRDHLNTTEEDYAWWPFSDITSTVFFIRSRDSSPTNIDLEEGLGHFIQTLSVPNLWLQTTYEPPKYISTLPIWYHCICGPTTKLVDRYNATTIDSNLSKEAFTYKLNDESESSTRFTDVSTKILEHCSCGPQNKKQDMPIDILHAVSSSKVFLSRPPDVVDHVLKFQNICSICLDGYLMGALLCLLPCHHIFHFECIYKWLTSRKHCCPTCRWPSYKMKV